MKKVKAEVNPRYHFIQLCSATCAVFKLSQSMPYLMHLFLVTNRTNKKKSTPYKNKGKKPTKSSSIHSKTIERNARTHTQAQMCRYAVPCVPVVEPILSSQA